MLAALYILSWASLGWAHLERKEMDELIAKELATLRPINSKAFSELYASDGELCVESGCYKGPHVVKLWIERSFAGVASCTCNVLDRSCYYLPKQNKAACRFACNMVLSGTECASDLFHGIIAYEWTNDGLIKRIDDYFSESSIPKTLAPCLPPGEGGPSLGKSAKEGGHKPVHVEL
eukprot:g76521.t1